MSSTQVITAKTEMDKMDKETSKTEMDKTEMDKTAATVSVPSDPSASSSPPSAIGPGALRFVVGIPVFDNPLLKRQWQLEHMAGAFRVFNRKGYTEGTSGHISVRDPLRPDTFWINPLGYHFGLLRAGDMVHVDEGGRILPDGHQAAVNVAGFMIHAAIHAARPDVHAACHTHSVHGKAWSAFGRPLDMLNQDACSFWRQHSVYAAFGGMVLEREEGARVAAALGGGKAVILQNHGILTVGGTVDEAAAYYTLFERACQVQLLVEQAGLPKTYVNDREAEYTQKEAITPEALYTDFQPDFLYEVRKAKGELRAI